MSTNCFTKVVKGPTAMGQLIKKPDKGFVLAKCVKNARGRVTFLVKFHVNDLKPY